MKLAKYQQDLLARLLTGEVNEGSSLANVLEGQVNLAHRLAIYQQSILGSRFAVLQQIFPCVEKLLGIDYFQQLAELFLQQHASHHVAIGEMWPTFVTFLQQHHVLQQVNYIADVAQFEGAWYRVFHGRNNRRMTTALPTDTDCLKCLDDIQLISSVYPVHLLWEMCQPEYRGDFQLPTSNHPTHLMLLQREHAVEIIVLNAEEWQLIDYLQQPNSIPKANEI